MCGYLQPSFSLTSSKVWYGISFAHIRFFGSDYLLNYFLIGLMFPAATAILPLYIRIRDLGLLDTYWGVILPQVAFGLGMSILLFRNYFRNLPEELFDAAGGRRRLGMRGRCGRQPGASPMVNAARKRAGRPCWPRPCR